MNVMNVNLIQSEVGVVRDLHHSSPLSPNLTQADHDTLQILDEHYERALEEGYVSYCAREECIFRNAALSVVALAVFIAIGTTVFSQNAHIPIVDSILFTMVTWTTTGYDTAKIHEDNALRAFLIFYIFCGIATLTIFVTEVYQYLALVAARSRYDYKKEYLALIFKTTHDSNVIRNLDTSRHGGSITSRFTMPIMLLFTNPANKHLRRIVHFFQDNPSGQLCLALIPCALIVLLSGIVFTFTEDWSYLTGIYFSTVSLTTTGYGDFIPTTLATKWFCIFWLPLSIPFMGWYMSGIARFFITVNERTIQKYEKRIRDKLRKMQKKSNSMTSPKRKANIIQPQISNSSTSSHDMEMTLQKQNMLGSVNDLTLIVEQDTNKMILQPSSIPLLDVSHKQESMKTMKHVLEAVRQKLAYSTTAVFHDRNQLRNQSPVAQYFSLRAAKQINAEEAGKPSFILRTLVLERLANIIANDVAGSQSTTDTHEISITVTFQKLKEVALKWLIPATALKSFYSVCTQSLFFVGMHTLEVNRSDALFELMSYDFHVLLGPFLADMGSSDDMEHWLKATNILAKELFIGLDVEESLRRRKLKSSGSLSSLSSSASLV